MDNFLLAALSFITLLTISAFVYMGAKRWQLPYTVSLVGVGMLVAMIAALPMASFIDDFTLTPPILLYVFLPILLFESAYNIRYREVLRSARSISSLAIISLIISAVLIGAGLHFGARWLGIEIPFMIALLFGSLISATDPVAVLALFKELGAPRRLTLIFEWESLFNDGTALALFLVVLSYIVASTNPLATAEHVNLFGHLLGLVLPHGLTSSLIIQGVLSFFLMIFVGMLFGGLCGVIFSKAIERIKNIEFLEIMLTLVLAHTTFILAEVVNHFLVPVSWVIATTIAAMVIGNYGRYKISPKVEEAMEKFWGFFAFVSNSLVFLLIGVMIASLHVAWGKMFVPVALSIIVVMIARAISVYGVIWPLNALKSEDPIPLSWQHMLSWGSLRGALAIIMVLLIPEHLTVAGWNLEMSVRDFVLALTVGCIVFTTFIKATTIVPLMKYFKIDKLHEIEEVEFIEGRMYMLIEVIAKIERLALNEYITEEERDLLMRQYQAEMHETKAALDSLISSKQDHLSDLIRRVVTLHALGIEKFHLKELYMYKEISEWAFKTLMRKIESQIYRIESGKQQLKEDNETDRLTYLERCLQTIQRYLTRQSDPILTRYMIARARRVTADKAIKGLVVLQGIDLIAGRKEFREVIALYEHFRAKAHQECNELQKSHHDTILSFDSGLINKSLLKTQASIVEDLFHKEIISPKLYLHFKDTIEAGMEQ